MKILQILSSAKGEHSVSTKLANAIVEKLQTANPGSSIVVKDLAHLEPPHVNSEILTAFNTPADSRIPAQAAAASLSDNDIAEVVDADVLVVGMGLYNYSIPSSLKAWIDFISRARITFKYNEQGMQVGMLQSKPVYVAIASGGIYRESPLKEMEMATPYFSLAMKMIGLNDIRIFRADGTGVPGYQDTTLQRAIDSIVL